MNRRYGQLVLLDYIVIDEHVKERLLGVNVLRG